jgi:3-hydroxyisobutyrate dehydrogenase-like beta-hydroxyacid dehydrogenase
MSAAQGIDLDVALIGYGEVGKIFARALAERGARVAIHDILLADADAGAQMRAHAASIGVAAHDTLRSAVEGAAVIISAVTASSSFDVVKQAAAVLRPGQYFLDFNSVSPKVKQASSGLIDRAGGHYVEAAVMASVPPYGIQVPMILGGVKREALASLLAPSGMSMQIGPAEIGVASAVKMCRSIMIKGLEALTVECMLTARRYGVEEQVIASLDETFPNMDWQKQADYLVSRVVDHGRRRAAEMREVARTVEDAGLQPLLAAPTAVRQDWMADLVRDGTVAKGEKSWRNVADAIAGRSGHAASKQSSR